MTEKIEPDPRAGQVRVVGRAQPGMGLVAHEVMFDVCQQDGTWIPLRGICRFTLDLTPDEFAAGHRVEIQIAELDLSFVGEQAVRRFVTMSWRWRAWNAWQGLRLRARRARRKHVGDTKWKRWQKVRRSGVSS